MNGTPIPANEPHRLRALYSFDILDTPREMAYDDLTKLAAQICACPISMISFVDHDRQWLKSTYGIMANQSPRDGGFCAHAIMEKELFEVEDATKDERFANHPFVQGAPFIRFYAAAPVLIDGDLAVGVICVIDSKPRQLTHEQREALKVFAEMVGTHLRIRKQNFELQEALRKRRESEKLLVHVSQMTALAEMAGGIAHEINNPLAVVAALASTLKETESWDGPEKREKRDRVLDKVIRNVHRISTIVKSLRSISRNTAGESFQLSSLKVICDEALELCRSRLESQGIELRVRDELSDANVECRPVQISQILLNLLNNAGDAIAGCDEKWIEIRMTNEGDRILLSVTDSGRGIESDTDKIFQPFFTTKETGKGTGLGLSISRSFAEGHNGQLWLDTSSERTRFLVSLPTRQSQRSFRTA